MFTHRTREPATPRRGHRKRSPFVSLAAIALVGTVVVGVSRLHAAPPARGATSIHAVPRAKASPEVAVAAKELLATPKPAHWRRAVRRCQHRAGHHFCDGPRRSPVPFGAAAARAKRLGLGTYKTASTCIVRRPRSAWIAAVDGKARRTLLWPVKNGRFGRGFGYVRRNLPNIPHEGVDVEAPPGSLVRAANDGIVAYSDNGVSGYGNLVILVHADGSVTMYAHMRAAYVFAGQRVLRGQTLGEVGSTGLSRGPHLHFEWHVRGRARDPMSRVVGRPGDGANS